MYNVAGEVAKTALENIQQAAKEVGKKSGFDIPGEASNFGARDFGKGDAGKPGSSFDGPWDKSETGPMQKEARYSDDLKISQDISHSGPGQETDEILSINRHLEGKEHPETEVRYERKDSAYPDGTKTEVVMPEFDPAYETKLDKNENGTYTGSRQKHERMCNDKLRNDVGKDPSLAEKFTQEKMEQIMDRETPDGYTWHHEAEPGKMELVDTKIHAETRHTGGYSIWGKPESVEA